MKRKSTSPAGRVTKRRRRGERPRQRYTFLAPRLGVERKYFDQTLGASTITAPIDASGGEHFPSASLTLNSVAQGDGETNRDGRRINLDSIYLNGTVFIPAASLLATQEQYPSVFVALVLDRQCNGAQFNSEDVFKNTSGSARLAANPLRNLQYSTRFKILASTVIDTKPTQKVGDTSNQERDGFQHTFKLYANLGGIITTFTGATADVANIVDNNIGVVAYCTSTDIGPLLYYQSRLRFRG